MERKKDHKTTIFILTAVMLILIIVVAFWTKNNLEYYKSTNEESIDNVDELPKTTKNNSQKSDVDINKKSIRFDVVMSFEIKPSEGISIIQNELKKAYPDYNINVIPDVDVSD